MYRPAGTADEVEVGGDFYDFFEPPAGWFALLGDVTGRGVPAGGANLPSALGARFPAKHYATPQPNPGRARRGPPSQPDLTPCSAVCLRLEPGQLVIATAGHPPLFDRPR
jgi:hypothetical protein